ncbi:MAG: hypothetical protein JSR43_12220 [Proteobacteria bacterium]|nr:hypothetical protein [Pseudomonadota bacterium]
MKIVVLGAGTLGTVYGVRLASVGHVITLVARGKRARVLREHGAKIENVLSGKHQTRYLPVVGDLQPDTKAALCLVVVRREQLLGLLPTLQEVQNIKRFLIMVNYAGDPLLLPSASGDKRFVLGFPGVAGSIENGIVKYVDVPEQKTAIETPNTDIAVLLRNAGFPVALVKDMPSWLRRHAVFVTAIAGARYEVGADAHQLSSDDVRVRNLILAVREGWRAMDKVAVAPEPLALRMIFRWVPLPFAVKYWRKLLAPPRGEYYFARHSRNATGEMLALANDVRRIVSNEEAPTLYRLYDAIDSFSAG